MVSMNDDPGEIIRGALIPLSPIPTALEPRLTYPGNIRAILFDIYGTLLISGTGDISLASPRDEADGIAEILARSGFPLLLDDAADEIPAIKEEFIRADHSRLESEGIDCPEVEIREIWSQVLEKLWNMGSLEYPPDGRDTGSLALQHELSVNPVWPMPGFPGIVQNLKEAGFRIGIVSNAQFYTPLILEKVTGSSLMELGFELSLCAWSYAMRRAKPSPEVFNSPLEKLKADGIEPEEILYVGNDMLNDVAAASQAGCRTALFAGDRRSLRMRDGDERAKCTPDMILTELKQLEYLVDKGVR